MVAVAHHVSKAYQVNIVAGYQFCRQIAAGVDYQITFAVLGQQFFLLNYPVVLLMITCFSGFDSDPRATNCRPYNQIAESGFRRSLAFTLSRPEQPVQRVQIGFCRRYDDITIRTPT
jgi:hypothetical protein